MLVDAAAGPLCRAFSIRRKWALLVSVVMFVALIGLVGVLAGTQISTQLGELIRRVPDAASYLERELGLSIPYLNGSGGSVRDLNQGRGSDGVDVPTALFAPLTSVGTVAATVVTDFILVVIGGIFLAADPRIYKRGLTKLFPPDQHGRVEDALDTCGRALQLWLLAQFIAMAIVGTLVGLGAFALGLPAPIGLAVFAGLAEFVPVIGPVVGSIPAMVIGFTQDMWTGLLTMLLFLAIQQLESNLITPLVQMRLVSIPPALLLFAVLDFGILFGWLGVLLAAPMTVVAFVLAQKLYVRQTLGEPVTIPGEAPKGQPAGG